MSTGLIVTVVVLGFFGIIFGGLVYIYLSSKSDAQAKVNKKISKKKAKREKAENSYLYAD
jgi:hypothetical protein